MYVISYGYRISTFQRLSWKRKHARHGNLMSHLKAKRFELLSFADICNYICIRMYNRWAERSGNDLLKSETPGLFYLLFLNFSGALVTLFVLRQTVLPPTQLIFKNLHMILGSK